MSSFPSTNELFALSAALSANTASLAANTAVMAATLLETAVDKAEGFAQAAADQIPLVEAAAAAVKYEREIDVIETGGIIPAIIDLATSIPSAESYGRLYAVRKAGTGTASVSLAKNGAPFYGPITISGTEVDLDPAIAAAAGDDVQVVIESVTGTVAAFYLKLERA